MTDSRTEGYNHLIYEKSPYLLQHAYNPVNWYPWTDEAFEKAKKEDKPIFLSIGYSTCHWCHVMERESFDDEQVAKLLNESYICIKVDREERPDIDNLYMEVSQVLLGSGGWPLNVFITPDKKPFFVSTYIPKESSSFRIGLTDLLPRLSDMWNDHRDKIISSSEQIVNILRLEKHYSERNDFDEQVLDTAFEHLQKSFDHKYGGFGQAPKFPISHNILFLLRYWKRTGNIEALQMVEKTLTAMRLGGIYDHIGFGFHRYSTDQKWLLPHFEKMLYDQALMAISYIETYQATGKEFYASVAKEILTYVLKDLYRADGGFYSGEDADSEGKEGKFYIWTKEEIAELFVESDFDLVCKLFNIKEEGNYFDELTHQKQQKNILYLNDLPKNIADELNIPEDEFNKLLGDIRSKLYSRRVKRIHPQKDDKVLTDWNGLIIVALAKAAQVFDNPKYLKAAENTANFILNYMIDSTGELMHRYRDGQVAIKAFNNDYANMVWGLIELYEATFNVMYLKEAIRLTDYHLEHFWDDKNGGFYLTSDEMKELIVRKKEIYDGAIPSGNSVAMLNLLRLGRITSKSFYEKKALDLARAFSSSVRKYPMSYTYLMTAVEFSVARIFEVVISGDINARKTKNMLKALRKLFEPNKIVLLRDSINGPDEIVDLASFTRHQMPIDGQTTAYVCCDYSCKTPTNDIEEMMNLLNS